MKKLLFASLLGLSIATLAGCSGEYDGGYTTGHVTEDGRFEAVGNAGKYDLMKDTKTGCIYIESQYSDGGISPLYDENGNVSGCGKKLNQVEEF